MATDRPCRVLLSVSLGAVLAAGLVSAASAQTVSAVTIASTGRPLVTGDVMTVIATGPANGAATFSIGGVRNGLPMRESISQPGAYIGIYAIRPGDRVSNSNVVVSITAPTGEVLTATAPAQLATDTTQQ